MSSLPQPEEGVFRNLYSIDYSDADALGRLRLTSLLNFLQVIAGDHTESLGFDSVQKRAEGVFWVLSRLTVEIDNLPYWQEELILDTWARATKAVLALRDYRFGSENQGRCGRATSAWVLLQNRKPQRPEPWVTIYKQIRAEQPVAEIPNALESLQTDSETNSFSVSAGWDDVDMNGHVNNVGAVRWCLAAHSVGFLKEWSPAFLEVNFLAEMFAEDTLRVFYRKTSRDDDSQTFEYSVEKTATQQPAFRMRIRFKKAT